MYGAKIEIMEPAHGEDAVWHQELNIVVVSPRLDAAGRERALDELQRQWRRALVQPGCEASKETAAAS